jgi:phospholipase C
MDSMENKKLLGPIEHVVVLMFENRSFDNMLGGLYEPGERFDGVPKGWSNPNTALSESIPAFQAKPGTGAGTMPNPDPLEDHNDMMSQINKNGPMQGFVDNYAIAKHSSVENAKNIMQFYAPGLDGYIPITSTLASTYAVSDQYHGSGPVQTWPNRIFTHCATPDRNGNKAYLNNTEYPDYPLMRGQLPLPSIFEKFDSVKGSEQINWKVYYDGEWPISTLVNYVHENWSWFSFDDGNVFKLQSDLFPDFFSDVRDGTLPAYSFIEPRYTDITLDPFKNHQPNSNHPGSKTPIGDDPAIDIAFGEQLLKEVYEALAANEELLKKTLLIVTYDEHGGLFDHVTPPTAVSPFESPVSNFDYTMYGPRVPAIFINPYIKSGSVLRPGDQPGKAKVFDHTSIIASLREHFNLGDALTPRDDSAPVFQGLVDVNNGLNPGPGKLPPLDLPSSEELSATSIPFDISKADKNSLHYVMYHAVEEMKRRQEEKNSDVWQTMKRFLKKFF